MPGFTIHIAVAKEYIKKHNGEIQNEEEFIKGSIAPDMNEDMSNKCSNKSLSHYGKWGNGNSYTNFTLFLQDDKVNLKQDYWKGYFLHLLTDYYFYNEYFKIEHENALKIGDAFYNDYDCLNKLLINKYKIKINENIQKNIQKYMNFLDGKPKYLTENKTVNFIEGMAEINFNEQIEIIKQNKMEGD